MSAVTVSGVERAVLDAFPASWAEPWDAVGLRVGDPAATVSGVVVTLDATVATVELACEQGANVLVSHHPPALGEHETFTPSGSTATMFAAASAGIALISAHTNLDRAPEGARVLMDALDLPAGEPLESGTAEMLSTVVFVPEQDARAVRSAMHAAGGGRIGRYTDCSFTAEGTGRFTSPLAASPGVGRAGESTEVEEVRIEIISTREAGSSLVGAIHAAHPYEEPLITATPVRIARGAARLGRVSELAVPLALSELVERTQSAFDCVPRVWGEATRKVQRVATATGSGSSLIPAALDAEADVMVLGEVRYHDALDAVANGIAIIELGHDVSEWPLVPVLASAVSETPGLDLGIVTVDGPSRAWWTP